MAIISKSDKKALRRYSSAQFRYAVTYVVVTFCVLLFLNVYCSKTSQELFFQSKKVSMIEKCKLSATEVSSLDILNPSTVSQAVSQMGSLQVNRLLVTDQSGLVLYDSLGTSGGQLALLPEIVTALSGRQGNDAFYSQYRNGVVLSHAATPIISYGVVVGCVYMTEQDGEMGALIATLGSNILTITMVLELAVILFSLAYSNTFSQRIRKILTSVRIIREGDYSHQVDMGGRDELTILGDEFNDLTRRLQTSEQKRRQFVSDASHELKTPLASIKLLTDSILQNDMDIATIREFVGDIGNEADRLNRMSQKLLSLSRIEAQADGDCEIIHMAPTIERVLRMLQAIAEHDGITIRTSWECDCPVLMLEDDLYQIAFNLVENGIKYNTPGGSLTLTLRRQEDNSVLEVADTGVGIPPEAVGHLFERFYRVDKARARKTGGSGLGLSIVRNLVERNGGRIQVESTLGQGSVFTVSFPIFDTEEDSQ